MGIGYLLGGIACLLYAVLVGYYGVIKKSPGLLKLVKTKTNKNMSDNAAVKTCLIAGGVVLAVGVFLFVFGAISGGDDKETTTQPMVKSNINVTVTGDGNVEASSHERLTFGSGGKVDVISVKEGGSVSKGDVLAKLDTSALELAEAQEQVALTQAQVALTQAQVALTQAKLAGQTAENNLKNTQDTEGTLELALSNA